MTPATDFSTDPAEQTAGALAWVMDQAAEGRTGIALTHERRGDHRIRFAGYAVGHAAAVILELGERARDCRTNEWDASRRNPAQGAERVALILARRIKWGLQRGNPEPGAIETAKKMGWSAPYPLADLYASSREREAAGLGL